jgi:ribose transport system substrate-binding protein
MNLYPKSFGLSDRPISSRGLLLVMTLLISAGLSSAADKIKPPKVILTVDTFDSEYWSDVILGAKNVAESLGRDVTIIASDYDGQKLISQFGALVSGGCDHCVVVTDPTSAAFLKPMVDRSADAGAQIVTLWNRPENLHPWDYHPEAWAMNTSFDGVKSGYENGRELCKALNGKGSITALEGIPDNPPAKQRIAGLKKALQEYPDVKLLDVQIGGWDQQKAYGITLTWLAKYGAQLNAVFSSNDSMALGVLAALKEKGLAGKVFITGSDGSLDVMKRIKDGEILSTMFVDPQRQGAVAMAFAYGAAVGDIDTNKLTPAQRDFNLREVLITRDNVDQYIVQKTTPPKYTYQELLGDFWMYSDGQIPIGANQ